MHNRPWVAILRDDFVAIRSSRTITCGTDWNTAENHPASSCLTLAPGCVDTGCQSPPQRIFLSGGMWIGSRCSKASPTFLHAYGWLPTLPQARCSPEVYPNRPPLRSVDARPPESALRPRCSEPSRKYPSRLLAAVAGSRALPGRFVQLSFIPDCHSLLRAARRLQTTSAAFPLARIVPILECSSDRTGHSSSLVLCVQSIGPPH